MNKLIQYPAEIAIKILKYSLLQDIYSLIGIYNQFLDPFICIIVDNDDSRNLSFFKSFKNVININHFQKNVDDLSKFPIFLIHISRETSIINKYNETPTLLTDIYIALKKMRRDTILLVEHLKKSNDFGIGSRISLEFIIETFNMLFAPYQENNLLIMRNILSEVSLPLKLNRRNYAGSFMSQNYAGNYTRNHAGNYIRSAKQPLEYLFHNIIIEETEKYLRIDAHEILKNKRTSLVYDLRYSKEVKESIIFRNIKHININIPDKLFKKKLHKRMFEVINSNIQTLESLHLERSNLGRSKLSIFNRLLKFAPNIYSNVKELSISFADTTSLNSVLFPKVEVLKIYYTYTTDVINLETVKPENVYQPLPNLREIQVIKNSYTDFKFIIHNSEVVKFGATYNFKLNKSATESTDSDIREGMTNKDIINILRLGIKVWDITKGIKRLELIENNSVKIFNKLLHEDINAFNNIEELFVSLVLFSTDKDDKEFDFLNKFFTSNRILRNVKILELELTPHNWAYLFFPSLLEHNLSSLEDLTLKGAWNRYGPFGLVETILKLEFVSLKVLRIDNLIFTQCSIFDLPNLKELTLNDVYDEEFMNGLTIHGNIPKLETLTLSYTDRNIILTDLISKEFQIRLENRYSLEEWRKSKPTVSIDQNIIRNLSNFDFCQKLVNVKAINKKLRNNDHIL